MTLRIAKYERMAKVFHKPKRLPTPIWAVVDDLAYVLFNTKRTFSFELKNALGLQDHSICSDCGVDFNNPREGECTEDCMCEEMDCRFNHVTSGERCDCEYCTDHISSWEPDEC